MIRFQSRAAALALALACFGTIAEAAEPRGERMTVRRLSTRSIAAQLGAARTLSLAAEASATPEKASRAAANAFEQQQSAGGRLVGGSIPAALSFGGSPAEAVAVSTETAPPTELPAAPPVGPTVNATPYQPHVDAAKAAGEGAKKKKNNAMMFIGLAIALLMLALMLLRRKGSGGQQKPAGYPPYEGYGGPEYVMPDSSIQPIGTDLPLDEVGDGIAGGDIVAPPGSTELPPLPEHLDLPGQAAGRASSPVPSSAGAPRKPAITRSPLQGALGKGAAPARLSGGSASAPAPMAQSPMLPAHVVENVGSPLGNALNGVVGTAGEAQQAAADPPTDPSDAVRRALAISLMVSAGVLIAQAFKSANDASGLADRAAREAHIITERYEQNPGEAGQEARLAGIARAKATGRDYVIRTDGHLYEDQVRPYAERVSAELREGAELGQGSPDNGGGAKTLKARAEKGIDLSSQLPKPVCTQGAIGSCQSFAGSALVHAAMARQDGRAPAVAPSPAAAFADLVTAHGRDGLLRGNAAIEEGGNPKEVVQNMLDRGVRKADYDSFTDRYLNGLRRFKGPDGRERARLHPGFKPQEEEMMASVQKDYESIEWWRRPFSPDPRKAYLDAVNDPGVRQMERNLLTGKAEKVVRLDGYRVAQKDFGGPGRDRWEVQRWLRAGAVAKAVDGELAQGRPVVVSMDVTEMKGYDSGLHAVVLYGKIGEDYLMRDSNELEPKTLPKGDLYRIYRVTTLLDRTENAVDKPSWEKFEWPKLPGRGSGRPDASSSLLLFSGLGLAALAGMKSRARA